MRSPMPCDRTEVHAAHFHRVPVRGSHLVVSCGGVDPSQGLAGERDRPAPVEFDWDPESLHLSEAAAMLVRAYSGEFASYAAMLDLWATLCGMDEAAALTFALQIATAVPPVTAVVPPF